MSLELLLDICREHKIEYEDILTAGEGQVLYRVYINRGYCHPRLLIMSDSYSNVPTGVKGICRFLSAYPLDQLKDIGIEIFPKINCIKKSHGNAKYKYSPKEGLSVKSVEASVIYQFLKGVRFNLCLNIRDTEDAYFRLDYTSMKKGVLTFRILDTASKYFNIEKDSEIYDGVGRQLLEIPKIKTTQDYPLQSYLKNQCNFDLINVYFPVCYSDYDRIACCSKIIEDCIIDLREVR